MYRTEHIYSLGGVILKYLTTYASSGLLDISRVRDRQLSLHELGPTASVLSSVSAIVMPSRASQGMSLVLLSCGVKCTAIAYAILVLHRVTSDASWHGFLLLVGRILQF
ncbi:hypothetical protein HBH56_135020 [Parastagonospora nodorum]|nr:hypothetical protein HBH56_135020 [Parastagonospora nodorum]KAH3927029.1 hypothetical protein HBH54_158270 [Parastagonospora nodorum]KAH4066730.1 hypothetical protein HBH50_142280 [Parastagonospora nodorum]KAH4086208.1 hypothetical protein HBH48_147710 [Parastagonospora nodorum]KAH4144271.1 hypothetical protein HBH45_024040 [Parastagonospora nodorum]